MELNGILEVIVSVVASLGGLSLIKFLFFMQPEKRKAQAEAGLKEVEKEERKLEVEKTGTKIMMADIAALPNRIISMPTGLKYAGVEVIIYNATDDTLSITGALSDVPYDLMTSENIGFGVSWTFKKRSLIRLLCMPFDMNLYDFADDDVYYADKGYFVGWIIKEVKEF